MPIFATPNSALDGHFRQMVSQEQAYKCVSICCYKCFESRPLAINSTFKRRRQRQHETGKRVTFHSECSAHLIECCSELLAPNFRSQCWRLALAHGSLPIDSDNIAYSNVLIMLHRCKSLLAVGHTAVVREPRCSRPIDDYCQKKIGK